MCCRYYMKDADPALAEYLRKAASSPLLSRFQRASPAPLLRVGEVRPTDLVPVLATNRQLEPEIFPMRWGFSAEGRPPIINARVETAGEKPSFREAWRMHRCAVPASWYFEWQHQPPREGRGGVRTKYAIRSAEGRLIWLCGLYRIENGLPVFVILTCAPGPELERIHDRMPLILPERAAREWVDPNAEPQRLLGARVTELLAEQAG